MTHPEDTELRRIEAMLRAIDPGRNAARELSQRRRRRIVWSWRHPLLAWCVRHHIAVSVAAAAVVVVALAIWMVCEQRTLLKKQEVPEAVSAPVRVLSGPDVTSPR